MLILGISGKKQSGKDTIGKYLVEALSERNIKVKVYSFADSLKKLCMEVLGLSYEQCYGSNEDKNTPTIYKWENLPLDIRNKYSLEEKVYGKQSHVEFPKKGFLTAREILQIVGTDLFRKMLAPDIWVKATFREIKKQCLDVAIIADVRFPEEVEAISSEGGYIVRLNRTIYKDYHESERALDHFDFNRPNIMMVDNQNKTIDEQNQIVYDFVNSLLF